MERPKNIPEAVWKAHLDWFSVTGETSRNHLRDLKEGKLSAKYRSTQQAYRKEEAEDGEEIGDEKGGKR